MRRHRQALAICVERYVVTLCYAVTPACNSVSAKRAEVMQLELGGFEPMKPETVAKSDAATVTFTKLADGKLKAMGGTWDREAHFLDDQVLEVRIRAGQPHFLRRPKILDPEDLPPSMMDALGWEEE